MIPGLFGLQKVSDIRSISAIGKNYSQMRTMARNRNLNDRRMTPLKNLESNGLVSPDYRLSFLPSPKASLNILRFHQRMRAKESLHTPPLFSPINLSLRY